MTTILSYKKEEVIRLHLDGFSSYKLAKLYKVKDNTMRHFLRSNNVLRKNTGYKIEQDMEEWFKKNKYKFVGRLSH